MATSDFQNALEERSEVVSSIHRGMSPENLANTNVRNAIAEHVIDLRNALTDVLTLHGRSRNASNDMLVDELNNIVAILIGYYCAILANRTDATPDVIGRAMERIECFLEEISRSVNASLPDCEQGYGLKAVAWDGIRFVVR